MITYEIEGNVFDTDIEWRSEGCYFKDKLLNKDFYQAILGLDYDFVNGLTVTVSGYTLQKPTFFKKSLRMEPCFMQEMHKVGLKE